MSGKREHDGADIYKRGKKWWGKWRQGKGLPPIRESLDTDSAKLAAELWKKRDEEIRSGVTKRAEITLGAACNLYWDKHVVPQALKSAGLIQLYSDRAIEYYGVGKLLTKIDRDGLRNYGKHLVAHAELDLCARVINQHIHFVPRLCAWVTRRGYVAPHFGKLGDRDDRVTLREETKPPPTIETEAEQNAIVAGFNAAAADLLPMFRMGQLSGTRKTELMVMTWAMVDWDAGMIRSRQKGDRPHDIPITDAIYDILKAEFGNHPVYIFTYVSRMPYHGKQSRSGERADRNLGERYPFSKGSLQPRWDEVRALAGIDLHFHASTRAFAIGKSYDANGELATMEAIGVESTSTVRLYAKRHGEDRKRATLEAISNPTWRESAYRKPAPKLKVVATPPGKI